MRNPVAYGFYPPIKPELEAILRSMFSPAKKSSGSRNIIGAVVPHAGYVYSGNVAANVYSLLKPCDTVIILGTNHTGLGEKAAVSQEAWQTPLGIVQTDAELAEKIVNEGKGLLSFDELAHMREHSIEVQLPFLQYAFKKFRMVAISISSDMDIVEYRKIADAINGAIKEKNAIIIASSDFTHFGEGYGFAPVSENRAEWVKKTDARLIEAILHFDAEKFHKLAKETTACGTGPIATLIFIMKKRAKRAELADYRTSFDVSRNEEMIVGYAGVVFGDWVRDKRI